MDFEINTIVSVDIDLLKIKFQNMSEEQIIEKVEKAWSHLLNGALYDDEDLDLHIMSLASFSPGLIRAKVIPNSLRVSSIESLEVEEDDNDEE